MQVIGRDTIIGSFIGRNGELLHETTAGWQLGTGRDRKIVTSMEEVKNFQEDVQKKVADWLADHGVENARQVLIDREVAEMATEMPGSLDAMADKLGPQVKSQLFQMLKSALHQTVAGGTHIPPSPPEHAVTGTQLIVDGKPVIEDANGVRHVLPDPALVEHPKVIPTDGGVLLDKGNGHKEFVMNDAMEDLEEEQALIEKRDRGLVGAGGGKKSGKRK